MSEVKSSTSPAYDSRPSSESNRGITLSEAMIVPRAVGFGDVLVFMK